MLSTVSYLTMMDKYLLLGFIALIVLVAENAFCGSIFQGTDDQEDKENLMDLVFLVTFSGMYSVTRSIRLIFISSPPLCE